VLQVFGLSWSPSGAQLATVSKDRKIRVYDPRQQTMPVTEGAGPDGVGGARICWACDGQLLVTAGFDKYVRYYYAN
jgi:coronin-7